MATKITKLIKKRVPKGKGNALDKYVGARVRALRESAGFTRGDICDQIGITHQQFGKYELGNDRISASRLYEIAKVLNLPLETFFPITSTQVIKYPTNRPAEYYIDRAIDCLESLKGSEKLVMRLEKVSAICKREFQDQ